MTERKGRNNSMEYSIIVNDVSKSFRGEMVLKNVSVKCRPGHIYGFVGKNGSGKTVLFKIICGLVNPDSGTVEVEGKKLGEEIDFPESMGLIIEQPGFLYTCSGFENLRYLASIKHKIDKEKIRETMAMVGLDWRMKKWVGHYSLGMRQRLGIAQAIMEEPSLLILDEPFNGLDRTGTAQMRQLIRELREQGRTILLASHNQADIDELCDTVCEMDAGVMTMIRQTRITGTQEDHQE